MFDRQNAFNKAYLGLKSQGFERCTSAMGGCEYTSKDGTKHCAWGWVDTNVPYGEGKFLSGLKYGVAATLNTSDLRFAEDLQSVHDCSITSEQMQVRLVAFAKKYNLTVPQEG